MTKNTYFLKNETTKTKTNLKMNKMKEKSFVFLYFEHFWSLIKKNGEKATKKY